MKMNEKERNELIAAMRNQTEFGRLNASAIEAAFDKMFELGFDIVKRAEPAKVVEPVVAAET